MSVPRLVPRRVGVISDTHGRLDSRVASAFRGVDVILHAGDVGSPAVLMELETIAPVTAVRGNMDFGGPLSAELEGVAHVDIAGRSFTIAHIKHDVPAVAAAESDVVLFGHSHRAAVYEVDGVLWVNPGSASEPRGAAEGRTVAVLELDGHGGVDARIVPLDHLEEHSDD